MKNIWKRIAGPGMAAVLIVSVLTGCAGRAGEAGKDTDGGETAMGRYLEEEVALPEKVKTLLDLQVLEDGTLRMAGGTDTETAVYDSGDKGNSWKKKFTVECREGEYLSGFSFAPDGGAGLILMDIAGGEAYQYVYRILDKDGKSRDLPITLPGNESPAEASSEQTQNMLTYLEFAGDGSLYGADLERQVYRISKETGEIERSWEFSGIVNDLLVLDEQMMTVAEEKVEFSDLESGKSEGTDQNMTKQLGESLGYYVVTGISPVLFERGEEKDTLYFCDSTGLYRHAVGGSVSEQIIDGALNSLASPDLGLISMGADRDGSFFIGVSQGGDFKILRYTYSRNTPSKPGTEIRVYTLRDNLEVRQAITMYQKEHPDIFISLQVGVTGEDGVTVSDALRTLNTDIAAGKGPDLFLLDGMPVESYIEKGLLRDISGIVKKVADSEGLYENITNQYRKGEELCAVPSRFSVPVLQAKAESLDQTGSLELIAEQAGGLRSQNPDAGKILDTSDQETLVKTLYAIDSPFWTEEDGSLKKERITRFFELLKEIYDLDKHQEGEQENTGVFIASAGQSSHRFMSDISVGAMKYMYGDMMMNIGMLSDMNGLSTVVSVNQARKDGGYQALSDGDRQIYVPEQILGISSQSQNTGEAESFVEYLLSEDAQRVNQGGGFPVNRAGFEKSLEDREGIENTEIAMSDTDGSMQTLEFVWPSDEEIQNLKETFQSLNTPALTDEVILEAVVGQGISCLDGSIGAGEAAENAMKKISLYLAE